MRVKVEKLTVRPDCNEKGENVYRFFGDPKKVEIKGNGGTYFKEHSGSNVKTDKGYVVVETDDGFRTIVEGSSKKGVFRVKSRQDVEGDSTIFTTLELPRQELLLLGSRTNEGIEAWRVKTLAEVPAGRRKSIKPNHQGQ